MSSRFKLPFLLAASGALLLLLPKINVLSIEGETAGLRVDDIVLGLLAIYLASIATLKTRLRFSILELLIGAFTLLGAVAWALQGGSPFYVVRVLEYFVFFYIGAGCTQNVALSTTIRVLFLANAVVMILQSLLLLGGFTNYGWAHDVGYRVNGLTAGPWEIGLVLNLCFCVMIFPLRGKTSPIMALALFAVFGYLLILTGGRMPILAQTVVFLFYLQQHFRKRVLTAALIIFTAGTIGGVLFSANTLVIERSRSSFNWQNIEAVANAYQATDLDRPDGIDLSVYFDANTDPSWIMRMSKWCFAVKTFVAAGPAGWVFGVGPGRFGPALDGGLLRLLTEHGIAGLLVFAGILYLLARKNSLLFACILAFSINLVFLDVHITYKVMALLFFISGYCSGIKSGQAESAALNCANPPLTPAGNLPSPTTQ